MLNVKKIEIPSKSTYKLDRIKSAAALADHPELGRKTLLIAGTNGKGSTCAYLTAFFKAAGYRVGTYSSPHVMDRCERIRIDGEPVTELELRAYEKKFSKILEPLTFFERYTLLAFLIFRDRKVEVQVLEVGLGGRLDATNISDPDLSVISKIDYDHEEILGNTLTKIATEKAGVMRIGRPVLVARQSPEALKALKNRAHKMDAEFSYVPELKFSKTVERKMRAVIRERGLHQYDNLKLAFSAFQRAMDQWAWDFNEVEILKYFRVSLWPARIQIVRKRPRFVVDGSHNLNSISALVGWLKHQRQRNPKQKKWSCVFGAMEDKAIPQMITPLLPFVSEVYLPTFYPERQKNALALQKTWRRRSGNKIRSTVIESLSENIKFLWSAKRPVLVVGSLYLAGAVLNEIKKID